MSDAVMQKIEALLPTLNRAVYLLNRQGRCLVPRQPDTFIMPASLQEEVPVTKNGYLFYTLPGTAQYTLCAKDGPDTKDLLTLCARLIASFHQADSTAYHAGSALAKLAKGELSLREAETLLLELGLQPDLPRAALLIRFVIPLTNMPLVTLYEYIPTAEDDLLIHLDSRSLLLALHLGENGQEDLREYAMALQDTLQNELGYSAVIGVGGRIEAMQGLPTSLNQAERAIEIGRIFHQQQQIFIHEELILERFLMDCAPQQTARYTQALFHEDSSRLFSEEMLDTIQVFFKNDLNLTDTARELYIHRNTLLYRLDKIQKGSGLDLRHFQDAMLFKLLNDLRRRDSALVSHTTPYQEGKTP